jgi:hypothetical protein
LSLAEIDEIAKQDRWKADRLRQMYLEIDSVLTPSARDRFHHQEPSIRNFYTAPRPVYGPLNLSGGRTWEKAYTALHGKETSTGEVGGNPAKH